MTDAIRAVARAVGVRLSDRCCTDGVSWDGDTLACLQEPGKEFSDGEMLHEICHWLAATDAERAAPEFGLVPRPSLVHTGFGRGPKWDAYCARVPKPLLEQKDRQVREAATGWLHWNVARHLDMGPVIPHIPWSTWLTYEDRWNEKGRPWLVARGLGPEALVARMVAAAQEAMQPEALPLAA